MVEDELFVGIFKNINAETRNMVEVFVVKDEFLVSIFSRLLQRPEKWWR